MKYRVDWNYEDSMDNFFNVVLALAILTAIAQLVFHFSSKRNPSISKFEKSFRHFVVGTVFYTLLMLVAFLHLPQLGSDTVVTGGDERTEVAVQDLVKNQQKLNRDLKEFRDVISLVLLMTALYTVSVVGILLHWRNERKKLLYQDAAQSRPLGLELD